MESLAWLVLGAFYFFAIVPTTGYLLAGKKYDEYLDCLGVGLAANLVFSFALGSGMAVAWALVTVGLINV